MFRFEYRQGIEPIQEPLSPKRHGGMFLAHQDLLDHTVQRKAHYLLVTGASGIGKSTFIDAWLLHLRKSGKDLGRPVMTIRVTPHVPANVPVQLNRMSGSLIVQQPGSGQTKQWRITIDPQFEIPLFKFKAGIDIGGSNPGTPIPELPLDQQAKNAKEQLVKAAMKKTLLSLASIQLLQSPWKNWITPARLGKWRRFLMPT